MTGKQFPLKCDGIILDAVKCYLRKRLSARGSKSWCKMCVIRQRGREREGEREERERENGGKR